MSVFECDREREREDFRVIVNVLPKLGRFRLLHTEMMSVHIPHFFHFASFKKKTIQLLRCPVSFYLFVIAYTLGNVGVFSHSF